MRTNGRPIDPSVNIASAKRKAPSKGAEKLRGFDVRIADNGGAIVSHRRPYDNGNYQPDPEMVFSTPAEVHEHIRGIYPDVKPSKPSNRQNVGGPPQ